jgi:hypothetical protein
MDEQQQYDKVCKPEFQQINEKLDNLYHRLFEDNDIESVQSKINRHEQFIINHNEQKQEEKTNWSVYLPVDVSILLVIGDFIFRYKTGK